jgi:phage terminase small subunit
MAARRAPSGLGKAGRALWNRVADPTAYELRPDELLLLEQCCRSADLIARMEAEAAAAGLTTAGSTGQVVINPVVAELRLQKVALARLLFQLGLPDDADGGVSLEHARSTLARKAALARWAH